MNPQVEDLLSVAEQLAGRLSAYQERSEPHLLDLTVRASLILRNLRARVETLRIAQPQVVFIAHKGVGKSTLINALAELWLDPPSKGFSQTELNAKAVLPLGTGGTTPCEIRIESGPWEVRVEPETEQETADLLTQFARWSWFQASASGKDAPPDSRSDATPGVHAARLQNDLERVVRGLVGLQQRMIDEGGVRTRRDEAHELAKSFATLDEYRAHILERARLAERKCVQWLPEGDPYHWLRTTLFNLVRGSFANQPFPARIAVRVPTTGVGTDGRVALVDTLGLPAVGKNEGESKVAPHPLSEREDLRAHLKNPWSLVVLGAQFNEPPSPATGALQQMMDEAVFFQETLEDRTLVAIVDPGSAGCGIEQDAEIDRATKEDTCTENLLRLGCPRGPSHANNWTHEQASSRVVCVNVLDGGVQALRARLNANIAKLFECHRAHLLRAVEDANEFFLNLGNAEHQAARRQIVGAFKVQLQSAIASDLPSIRVFGANLLQPFVDDCRALHPSTLRSLVVHKGDSKKQSAWALCESATTRALARLLQTTRRQVVICAKTLEKQAWGHGPQGRAIIHQEAAQREALLDEFSRRLIGGLVFATKTRLDEWPPVWQACEREWGRTVSASTPGYKVRVAKHLEDWSLDIVAEIRDELRERLSGALLSDDIGLVTAFLGEQ